MIHMNMPDRELFVLVQDARGHASIFQAVTATLVCKVRRQTTG